MFVGFCLVNTIAIAIDCAFNGFGYFVERFLDLPFLLYLCFSLVISIILIIVIKRKTK